VLELLALGAKDEVIARHLGVSLRTARRRVADLFDELGAATRFQAGVEAGRRGWV
jgi:DNA-binding NarL/FixJ family response regulator